MKILLTFLLFYITFSQDLSCPTQCNNHGVCAGGMCSCFEGWSGSDCSIQLENLQSGVTKEGSVDSWKYHYYNINNPTVGDITVQVSPLATSNSLADCDVYIRKNDLPSVLAYDEKNIDWGTESTTVIKNADVALWYIAVYANFVKCDYSIKVTLPGACVSNCGGHGTCNGGTCTCFAGYAGADCSTEVTSLAVNVPAISGSVEESHWKYYSINLPSTVSELVVEMNITNSPIQEHDCDVYVKYEAIPSLTSWDYVDPFIQSSVVMHIPTPKVGNWYVGIWGFKQCEYLLHAVSAINQCVSQCSDHGTCSGTTCQCSFSYSGDYCENKTQPLVGNQPVTGFVDQNIWNYYTFQSFTQDNIVITVSQTTPTGDCDLYVRFDEVPTRFQFDFIHITTESTFTLTIPNAVGRVIHIGILGWTASAYSLTVSVSPTCTTCIHGQCAAGRCLCEASWYGDACDKQLPGLQSGVQISASNLTANQWHYYHFQTTSTTVVIALQETIPNPESGLLYLLVQESDPPTLGQYKSGAVSLNKSFKYINLVLDDRVGETIDWVIGVYGTGYIVNPVSYSIVAFDFAISK